MPVPTIEAESHTALADQLVDRLDEIIRGAESAGQPLEIDPYREQIFELFVVAEASGLTADDAEPDLSSDGVCRRLASRWELDDAAQMSFVKQERLPPDQLQKMRSLWSVMRMWMEWNYAWHRWSEFHEGEQAG